MRQIWSYDLLFGKLVIKQAEDGGVQVELIMEGSRTVLESNPATGELRLYTPRALVG